MPISVLDPIRPSVDRTRQMLFRPFDLGKWFVLGFTAWLAEIGQGGGGGGFPNFQARVPAGGGGKPAAPGAGAGGGVPPVLRQALDWVRENLALVIGIGAAVLLLVVVVSLLMGWIQGRFRFIFLDDVVRDRAEVARPWTEFRREGNSLFGFQVLLSLAMFVLVATLGVLGLALAWPDLQAGRFGGPAVTALVVVVPAFLLLMLAGVVVNALLHDFVVPIMYLRRQGVIASWRDFQAELLPGNIGKLVLYLVFRVFVIGLALGVLGVGLTCLTCCLAALPYLGSVILLPLSVFSRQYPLFYLEQYGGPWRFFDGGKPPSADLEFLDV